MMPEHAPLEVAVVRRDREWKLFLDLCAPLSHEVGDLPEPDEWPQMLGRLEQTRFEALAYHNLRARGLDDAVPAEVMVHLRAANAQALARYHLLGEMVSPHLEALAREVDFLVLKGAAWAHTVYPEPHLRQSGDIDLLVKQEDQAAAGRVLECRGAEVSWPLYRDHGPTYRLRGLGGGSVFLELHPDLSMPSMFPYLREGTAEEGATSECLWGTPTRLTSPSVGYIQVWCQLARDLRHGGYARYLIDIMHLADAEAYDAAWVREVMATSGLKGLECCGLTLLGRRGLPKSSNRLAAVATAVFRMGLTSRWVRSGRIRANVAAIASLLLWDHADDRRRYVLGVAGSLVLRLQGRLRSLLGSRA